MKHKEKKINFHFTFKRQQIKKFQFSSLKVVIIIIIIKSRRKSIEWFDGFKIVNDDLNQKGRRKRVERRDIYEKVEFIKINIKLKSRKTIKNTSFSILKDL